MSNDAWWANKLGNKGPGVSTPATGPLPGNVYKATTNQPTVRVSYDPEQDQLVSKAVSARSSDTCPNCMSGNYFAPQGTQRMRCYDCGYPVIQSATGSGLPSSSSGPATPSKQVGTSGFNPTVIVDRIG